MKIGVISDTHGCRDHWAKAYDKFFKDADLRPVTTLWSTGCILPN